MTTNNTIQVTSPVAAGTSSIFTTRFADKEKIVEKLLNYQILLAKTCKSF